MRLIEHGEQLFQTRLIPGCQMELASGRIETDGEIRIERPEQRAGHAVFRRWQPFDQAARLIGGINQAAYGRRIALPFQQQLLPLPEEGSAIGGGIRFIDGAAVATS